MTVERFMALVVEVVTGIAVNELADLLGETRVSLPRAAM
jgi:hypothetical protein